MPTIREIAEECGVSKSTAARVAKHLGIEGTKSGDGRGTLNLQSDEASVLAHELTKRRKKEEDRIAKHRFEPIQSDIEPIQSGIDTAKSESRIELLYEARISDLKEQISLLVKQLETRDMRIEKLEHELESNREQLSIQKRQTESARIEVAQLKETIEKMRTAPLGVRVFGFKKLLPKPTESES